MLLQVLSCQVLLQLFRLDIGDRVAQRFSEWVQAVYAYQIPWNVWIAMLVILKKTIAAQCQWTYSH
jgi:hypothetical protein